MSTPLADLRAYSLDLAQLRAAGREPDTVSDLIEDFMQICWTKLSPAEQAAYRAWPWPLPVKLDRETAAS